MRLLVTGVSGLLGHHVARQAPSTWQVTGTVGTRPADTQVETIPFDLCTDPSALIESLAPDILIHCAAMSESHQCEADPDFAVRVNVDATERLARAMAGRRFVLVSTDLVFDGAAAPYSEQSTPNPLGWYGRTKAMAEERVQALPNTLVVRTSLLVGPSPSGRRSVEERLGLQLGAGQPARLFTDEYRSPVFAPDLAAALLVLARGEHSGILHLGGPECLSRYDLGVQLARHFGWDLNLVVPALGSTYPSTPPRPRNVCLDSRRALAVLGKLPRSIAEIYP